MPLTLDIPPHERQVITQACHLSGMSINEFIRQQAYQNALTMINDNNTWQVNATDMQTIMTELANPAKPNQTMKALLKEGAELC